MGTELIKGVFFLEIDPIKGPGGNVMHCIRGLDTGLETFGEAYFSTIYAREIKGWRRHTQMTCNLFIPYGEVQFIFYDDRPDSIDYGKTAEFIFSSQDYGRLIILPGIWFGFRGTNKSDESILLNIASMKHDPAESERLDADSAEIPYNWKSNVLNSI